ncbi:YciI family protein [Caballeronia sordidicola]|jgi:uncharacterized protein YciI|uniref:YciI family protein n=1 Tax=Caballeronia sordidicola TaxID=196367 RepID=UPI0004D012D2|nr:YciI family protein [Caballeronia sordidicola]
MRVPFTLKEFPERKLENSFFVFRGMDHPQSGDIRERLTDEQRAYVKEVGRVKMIHGGLLYTSDDRIAGTFLILDAATSTDVRNWVHTSPFHKGGLFATISIDRWGWTYGRSP